MNVKVHKTALVIDHDTPIIHKSFGNSIYMYMYMYIYIYIYIYIKLQKH